MNKEDSLLEEESMIVTDGTGVRKSVRQSAQRSASRLTNRGGISNVDIENTVMRVLSEKGVTLAVITVKDLSERFAKHEARLSETRQIVDKHERGLVQLTETVGSNKTGLREEIYEVRNELAKETKRITYIIHEHDQLQREWNTKIPQLDSRLNVNETRRLDIERDIMSISDRIPQNCELLLKTVQEVQDKLRTKTQDDEKRLTMLEIDTKMLKKK